MKKRVILEELEAFVGDFVENLKPREEGATIVALSGNLGAGKTTFTQMAAKALGVGEVITSPTFVIEKVYRLEGQKFAKMIHIDAYRLKGGEEFASLGWDEIAGDKGNVIFIEWPENVEGLIPKSAITIKLDVVDESSRMIERL